MTDFEAPAPQVWPSLRADDAPALIRFLVEAFGFEETVTYSDGDVIQHCQLDWPPGGGVMLGSVRDDPGNPWRLTPGTFGAYVVADDVDALHARAVAAGAEILRPPFDTGYGSRDFMARDPEGNLWSFGTYRGEAREDHRSGTAGARSRPVGDTGRDRNPSPRADQ